MRTFWRFPQPLMTRLVTDCDWIRAYSSEPHSLRSISVSLGQEVAGETTKLWRLELPQKSTFSTGRV